MIPNDCKSWLRCLVVVVAAAALPSPGLALAPAPPPERIVAVGDLHGDHDVWLAIARAAGLIDARGQWSGGKTVLVQTGDIVDRAPDSLKIIRDLMRLEREASRAGGRVVVLVGNHEAMMVTGDLRYVDPGEYAAFADKRSARRRSDFYDGRRVAIEAFYKQKDATLSPKAIRDRWLAATPLGQIEHQAAWHPAGELGRWIVAKPAVAKIGDSLFVHGGISVAYAAVPIDEINRRVAAALVARDTAPGSIINDPLGPLWYRGLAGMTAEPPAAPVAKGGTATVPAPLLSIDQQLDQLLAATRARRIVIGHTPLMSGVAVTHGGRLVRIDSGNSRVYGGVPGYAEIRTGGAVARNIPRPATMR